MAEMENKKLLRKFDFMTDNDYKLYNLSWTINNFSFHKELDSPPLRPAPDCEMRLYFKKLKSEIFLYLGNELENEFEARVSLVIKKTKKKIWYQSTNTFVFRPNEKKDILGSVTFMYHELNKLKNDTFVIVCSMAIIKKFTTKQLIPENVDPPKKYDGVRKLAEDLRTLCTKKRHVDVTFKLNDKEISSNKAILGARSPKFDRMFRENPNDQENCTIEIDDVTSTVFEKLLDFLHTGEWNVDIDYNSAAALYYAADKYEVLDLRKICAHTLMSKVTTKSVIRTLVIAGRHKDDDLKAVASTLLWKNIHEYVQTGQFDEFVSTESELAAEVIMHFTKIMSGVVETVNLSMFDGK